MMTSTQSLRGFLTLLLLPAVVGATVMGGAGGGPKTQPTTDGATLDVRALAEQYVSWDPNEETREAVRRLLDAEDLPALETARVIKDL